jgi:hypothetical protein
MTRDNAQPEGGVPPDAGRYFDGIAFPASKASVVADVELRGAPQSVLDALQAAPAESFEGLAEALESLR